MSRGAWPSIASTSRYTTSPRSRRAITCVPQSRPRRPRSRAPGKLRGSVHRRSRNRGTAGERNRRLWRRRQRRTRSNRGGTRKVRFLFQVGIAGHQEVRSRRLGRDVAADRLARPAAVERGRDIGDARQVVVGRAEIVHLRAADGAYRRPHHTRPRRGHREPQHGRGRAIRWTIPGATPCTSRSPLAQSDPPIHHSIQFSVYRKSPNSSSISSAHPSDGIGRSPPRPEGGTRRAGLPGGRK